MVCAALRNAVGIFINLHEHVRADRLQEFEQPLVDDGAWASLHAPNVLLVGADLLGELPLRLPPNEARLLQHPPQRFSTSDFTAKDHGCFS